MLRLAAVWILSLSLSLACSTPVISPPGFNASENAEAAVTFRCLITSLNTERATDTSWLINDTSTTNLMIEDHGIFLDEAVETENETEYVEIHIRPTAENNGTTLQCRVLLPNDSAVRSQVVIFRVQGPLSPPTDLSTVRLNSTHDYLVWEDPPTLDLTDQDPDITGYTVSLLTEEPPHVYPHEYTLSLAELGNYTEQNFSFSSTRDQQFPVLRYGFPVWFRVSAWNPAGQGETSQYHMIEPPSNCTRIEDSISPEARSTVSLIGSHPSLEILLFQPQQQIDYCFHLLVLEIHNESPCSQHVLLPTLNEDGNVSLKVESGLKKDGHFTALLYFNSSLLIQTNFSTFDIQDVLISVLPNGLTVECQFAEGSEANTCNVVLILEGEEVLQEEIDSQKTFTGLRSGQYTVSVYESISGSGGGEPLPAVERTVTITGDIATGTASPSPTPGVTDKSGGSISTALLVLLVGVSLFIAVLTVLLLVTAGLVVMNRHKRSREYSLKQREEGELASEPKARNVLPETGQERRCSPTPVAESVQGFEDPTYEEVDMKKKKALKKKKESKPFAIPMTQQEKEAIANHTYSTVNKTPSSKKMKRQDSSPPPIPPQTFSEDYAQEFLGTSQLQGEEKGASVDTPLDMTGQEAKDSLHIYDSLHPATHSPSHASHADTQAPPMIPPKLDPLYDSIKSPPLSSSNTPSPPHSPTDDADTSALIQQSPQRSISDLIPEPTVSTAPHPQPHLHHSLTHLPAHAGSHHSMTMALESIPQSQAPPTTHRPQSMNVQQYMDSEHSIQHSLGRRMSSMPLLSSDLQDDV